MSISLIPDEKIGNFEWIMDYNDFKDDLDNELSKIYGPNFAETKRVLVVGCGTSELSASMLESGYQSIVSIDNDEECIRHLSDQYHSDQRLSWIVYDVVEPFRYEHNPELNDGGFDIVVDKGTLDAVLVEGSCATMLLEIYRLLKPISGVYVICSIHEEELLQALLTTPALGFTINFLTNEKQKNISFGTIAICQKVLSNTLLDLNELIKEEEEVMDLFYKNQHPLLTPEKEAQLHEIFNLTEFQELSIEDAYESVFANDDRLGYSLEMFLEDLKEFSLRRDGYISVSEMIQFLKEKQ